MAIEKRKVTMRSAVITPEGVSTTGATDYVPVDILDAYVADARTKWQEVTVGEEHDPGPVGDDGLTSYPAHLDHPLAGRAFHNDVEVHDVEAWHAKRATAAKRKAR